MFRRWLRLLFGGEFSLMDLLVLWDTIFANSLKFAIVDNIFVSMLVLLRVQCKYILNCIFVFKCNNIVLCF